MKNMTKLLLAFVLVAGVGVGASYADNDTVLAPRDAKGMTVHPLYGGFKAVRISGTSETLVCSGRCILGGLYMSTGPVGTYLQVRDSGTADNTTSLATKMLPIIGFVNTNTDAVGNKIPMPIRTSNGIVAKLSAASNNEDAVILYIDGDE